MRLDKHRPIINATLVYRLMQYIIYKSLILAQKYIYFTEMKTRHQSCPCYLVSIVFSTEEPN